MDSNSAAASRRAAQRHARTVAAGPPRSARWTFPAAGVSALAAAVVLPLFLPAAVVLVAVTGLLLAVHRADRRDAWRYAPEPVAPARFLPPLRPVTPVAVIDLTAEVEAATLIVPAADLPTPVVVPGVPTPRVGGVGVDLERPPAVGSAGPSTGTRQPS